MANETDGERLFVLLEARIRDFERNMARASATAGREFGQVRRDSRRATRDMEQDMQRSTSRINQALAATSTRIGDFGKAFVAGIAAGGIAGIVSQMRQAAEAVAMVGDEAQRAGLSTKVFQQLGYVADQNRIEVDALIDAMKEMQLRADEFIVTGAGAGSEAFMRLGYSADILKEKIKDPSDLMLEMIGRLQRLDKAAQIRVADEVFGGEGGERFVELIDLGEDGIREMMRRAEDLGVVMDEELIAKAAEVDRKFREISMVAGVNLKSAIVEAASALNLFIGKIDEIDAGLAAIGNASVFKWLNDRMGYNDPDAMRAAGLTPMPGVESFSPDSRIANAFDATAGTGEDEIEAKPKRTPLVVDIPVDDWKPIIPPEKAKRGGGASARDREAEAAKREAEAVADLIIELERERSLIGATDAERRISDALRTAGAAATEEQKQKIGDLIGAIEAEKIALDGLKEAQEEIASITGDTLRGIADDFRAGADGAEILGNALDRIADKLIDMAINNLVQNALGGIGGAGASGGGGFLAGFMSIFGGMRAAGGPVSAGKVYGVGEQGPELFAPRQSGIIIPNHALARPISADGGAASRAPQVIDIRLLDDTGRMADIARKEIKTASGDIVRVSVQQSLQQGARTLPTMQADKQRRGI